jgi:hypothetical protein
MHPPNPFTVKQIEPMQGRLPRLGGAAKPDNSAPCASKNYARAARWPGARLSSFFEEFARRRDGPAIAKSELV